MEDTACVILNKLKLVDPTTATLTLSSAYQQSAEVYIHILQSPLWERVYSYLIDDI